MTKIKAAKIDFFNLNRSEHRAEVNEKEQNFYNWYIAFFMNGRGKKSLIIINDRAKVFSFSFVYHPQHDRKKGLFLAKNLDTRNANIWQRARFWRNL